MGANAWYGCRRDTKDGRDTVFRFRAARVPVAVDLRGKCPPAMDQGELGSCTAHAITAALRYLLRRSGEDDVPLSRLQLYYDERTREGTVGEDAGAEIRTGIKVVAKSGVAVENLWPYDIAQFRQQPPEFARKMARFFGAVTYERVPVGSLALKQALAQGFPVIIGASLYDSFESDAVAKTGVVPTPRLSAGEGLAGGHAMLCVGYGRRPGYFTVLNSWGADWGDGGFCYFPESYLGSTLHSSDFWIIKSAGTVPG